MNGQNKTQGLKKRDDHVSCRRFKCSAIICGIVTALTATTALGTPPTTREQDQVRFDTHVQPLLESYCYDCHGDDKTKADLNLEAFFTIEEVLADKKLWNHVSQNITQHVMPPKEKRAPTLAERDVITQWIDQTLYKIDPDKPDPGHVTLRRLNRAEYNNTIRDLVGIDFRPAKDFPADDTGYGFDNIGDVLSLSPLLMNQYFTAAGEVMDRAFISDIKTNSFTPYPSSTVRVAREIGLAQKDQVILWSNGEATILHDFKLDGKYELKARVWADHAGEEDPRIEIHYTNIGVTSRAIKGTSDAPQDIKVNFIARRGENTVSISFINDYYVQEADGRPEADSNIYFDSLEIHGPVDLPPGRREARQRILTEAPDSNSPRKQRAAAERIIENFASRAFRRPLSRGQRADLITIYDDVRRDGDDFESGIKQACRAVLISPNFLFRGDVEPSRRRASKVHPIDEYALASRLSYFLWSSMPDDELFALAKQKDLRDTLDAQISRMLADQRAESLVGNFMGQWLQFRDLLNKAPDERTYAEFYRKRIRSSMLKETRETVRYIIKHNRSVLELLDAPYTFLNEALAAHYDIPGVSGDEFRRVELNSNRRGGLLRQGSIMLLTSYPKRTSPVKRGNWILENILGTPPPPAPGDVPSLEKNEKIDHNVSFREKLAIHRDNPSCTSCHAMMDPIGLAFEHYDPVGAWRDTDGKAAIDTSGQLSTGEAFVDADALIQILTTTKKDQFVRTMANRMLTFAIGRGLEYYDRSALDQICADTAQNGYTFSAMVRAVVRSVPFQKQRAERQEG
ncbi:MAG: hypothetical protein ACI9X0_001321 [Kiritimatiellia bacterium]